MDRINVSFFGRFAVVPDSCDVRSDIEQSEEGIAVDC